MAPSSPTPPDLPAPRAAVGPASNERRASDIPPGGRPGHLIEPGERASISVSPRDWYRPYRRQIAALGVISLIGAQLEALALVLIVPLAQSVANQQTKSNGSFGPFEVSLQVKHLVVITVGCILAAGLANVFLGWYRSRVLAHFEEHHRNALLDDFVQADWPTQQAVRQGRLQQLSNFTGKASSILANITSGMRAGLSMLTFVFISMLIDFRAAAAILIAGILLFLAIRPLAHRVKARNKVLSGLSVEYAQDLTEIAYQARELRIFGAAETITDRLAELSGTIATERSRAMFLGSLMSPAYQYAGLLLVLAAVLIASSVQSLAIGALGAIALLLLRSLSYGQQLQNSYQSIVETTPYLEFLDEARTTYRDNASPSGGVPLESVDSIEFKGVSYTYDGTTDAVEDLDLRLDMGQVVGVVGPSGSGKSTLSQLLLRLREPTGGQILINGQPSTDFSLSSWYKRITLVPQESRLLHASVFDNISLMNPATSREQVIEASKQAGIHDVVMSLDDGYDTLVGPSSRDLSGGQIQRIGIARALARNAQVLVLDEPTSALDVHSEALIQDTLRALHGEVLLVVIAHRLSTLSICDRLVVLHEGRLEANGPLAEVFESNEFFRTAMDTGLLDLSTAGPDPR